jgi:cob(I)alamin adenosyltransferase
MKNEDIHGLVIVHTGNGKGKTTAALGLAVRAWGQGLRILILQFIKGKWKYGELKALEKFSPQVKIRALGKGFTRKNASAEDVVLHQTAAADAIAEAKAEIEKGLWDMVILDEINYAVKFGLISLSQVVDLVEKKPSAMHLVLTGRDAAPEIIERADLVTEMKEIKHPYKSGIPAQIGIEF